MTVAGRMLRCLIGCTGLGLACLVATAAGVLAETTPPDPGSPPRRSGPPGDALSLTRGSADSWSVLNGDAGCYLLSAYRVGSSRLAVGRHPALGEGLFVIGLGLSLPDMAAPEPMSVQTRSGAFAAEGRVVGPLLLFASLSPSELQATLQELDESGLLWVVVRKAAIAHGGAGVVSALAEFRRTCGIG